MEEGLAGAHAVLVKTIERIRSDGEQCPVTVIQRTVRALLGTSHPVSAVLQVAIHVKDVERGISLEDIRAGVNERLDKGTREVINTQMVQKRLGFVEVIPGSSYYCTVDPTSDLVKAASIKAISDNIEEWWLPGIATVTFLLSRPLEYIFLD